MYSTQKILIIIKILLIDAPRAFMLKIHLETFKFKIVWSLCVYGCIVYEITTITLFILKIFTLNPTSKTPFNIVIIFSQQIIGG